ncbi:FAD-dependent oxidoreductase [Solitalea koreensis]|uniref:Kynurenine 3-monooxygenase n=1 Tax=Solitalea koreensis TaxID=543615 RepID=A0A521BDP0_9SPHI|nr:NAD(P)/FAD-dependent oxidoreductase [Solitalea koreensis]SMO45207.1 kynurenine 3-monooxygenase [Solitalea koreensis]
MSQKVIIVGAGLTGSLLTIYLARRGFNVEVYERRADMRIVNISAGKSINLALSTRGIHALDQVGLAEEVLKTAVAMKGRMIHSNKGELTFQPYGKNENEYINSISRKDLNVILMNEAEKFPNVQIYFNQRCTGMSLETGEAYFVNETHGGSSVVSGDTVIGTDGSASAIRMEFLRSKHFNFSQSYENYGYKELTIPTAEGGGFRIEKNALHIWPRGSYMMIALPNVEGDFTCTLFMNYENGEYNLNKLVARTDVTQFFQKVMPDALELMPELVDDFFNNPTGSLLTIKCYPWNINGKALLMGDAAHAILPFFGQGMNCGFEDCYYFDKLIEKHGTDWQKIFEEFGKLRKENADAIAELALENFVEMRDLVAHKDFLLKKKADVLLEERYPERFISKYAMVTFHRIPYAIAMKRGQIQDRILMEMCSKIDSIDELNLEEAFDRIKTEFAKAGIEEKLKLEV